MARDRELYEIKARLKGAEAHRYLHLEMFGDDIAEREGYKELNGLDAIHYYLICKFNWLPSQVRTMSPDDLLFVLTEEMSRWTVPKELRGLSLSDDKP